MDDLHAPDLPRGKVRLCVLLRALDQRDEARVPRQLPPANPRRFNYACMWSKEPADIKDALPLGNQSAGILGSQKTTQAVRARKSIRPT